MTEIVPEIPSAIDDEEDSIESDISDPRRLPARNDHATIDRLVSKNIALAKFFANRAMDIDPDEAFSQCMRGLLRAAELFDEEKGKFSAYAAIRIKQCLNLVRTSRNAKKRGSGIQNLSLDFEYEEGEYCFADRIADPNGDPLKEVDASGNAELIAGALVKLDARSAEIVRRRFGIECEAQTLEEIAKDFKLTRERIRQIENKALQTLRFKIKDAEKEAIEAHTAEQVPEKKETAKRGRPRIAKVAFWATCEKCGSRRHPLSAARCRRCYRGEALQKKRERFRLACGKFREALAAKVGVLVLTGHASLTDFPPDLMAELSIERLFAPGLPRMKTGTTEGGNKHADYRARNRIAGTCPHCGKPCAPYSECEARREYKRRNRYLNKSPTR